MNLQSRIFVAGHRGLAGSAIVRSLADRGYENLLIRSRDELDLTDQQKVHAFFGEERPEYVFLAAGKVGGILANSTYPAEFIYQNCMIAFNVIHASHLFGVKKLVNLGSSCIYPKFAPQPLKEEYLLSGKLEPTNEAYAVAKISAIKLCRYYNEQYGTNFISVMPTNLFGPNDNFNLKTAHVLPALLSKILRAKDESLPFFEVWGTGSVKREFLYVDDLADAVVFLMNNCNAEDIGEVLNIGTGKDITIEELAKLIATTVGYPGQIRWDSSKPDGTPQKLLDISAMNSLGWKPSTGLADGIRKTYEWYLANSRLQRGEMSLSERSSEPIISKPLPRNLPEGEIPAVELRH